MQQNNTIQNQPSTAQSPQKIPSRSFRLGWGIVGIILPLAIVFGFSMIFGSIRVINASEDQRMVTEAYVIDNFIDTSGRRLPSTRHIEVTFSTQEGVKTDTTMILYPRHRDLPEYEQLRPGGTVEIAYLSDSPSGTAYPASIQGRSEYFGAITSALGGIGIFITVVLASLGGIIMVAASLLLVFTSGDDNYRARLQSWKPWAISFAIATILYVLVYQFSYSIL